MLTSSSDSNFDKLSRLVGEEDTSSSFASEPQPVFDDSNGSRQNIQERQSKEEKAEKAQIDFLLPKLKNVLEAGGSGHVVTVTIPHFKDIVIELRDGLEVTEVAEWFLEGGFSSELSFQSLAVVDAFSLQTFKFLSRHNDKCAIGAFIHSKKTVINELSGVMQNSISVYHNIIQHLSLSVKRCWFDTRYNQRDYRIELYTIEASNPVGSRGQHDESHAAILIRFVEGGVSIPMQDEVSSDNDCRFSQLDHEAFESIKFSRGNSISHVLAQTELPDKSIVPFSGGPSAIRSRENQTSQVSVQEELLDEGIVPFGGNSSDMRFRANHPSILPTQLLHSSREALGDRLHAQIYGHDQKSPSHHGAVTEEITVQTGRATQPKNSSSSFASWLAWGALTLIGAAAGAAAAFFLLAVTSPLIIAGAAILGAIGLTGIVKLGKEVVSCCSGEPDSSDQTNSSQSVDIKTSGGTTIATRGASASINVKKRMSPSTLSSPSPRGRSIVRGNSTFFGGGRRQNGKQQLLLPKMRPQ